MSSHSDRPSPPRPPLPPASGDVETPGPARCEGPPRGRAPGLAGAAGIDWSADAASAAVGRMVETLGAADRLMAQALEAVIRVVDTDATRDTLGVAPELVLSQTCRVVGFERRVLLRAVRHLCRMPATRQAFREGQVSWSQVRAILTAVGRVDVAGRAHIDTLVRELAPAYVEFEADHLVWEVDALADRLVADAEAARDPVADNRVVLTPRPDGSGSLYGEYDAAHFPLLAQAVDNMAAARHPLATTPDVPDPDDDAGDAALTDAYRHAARLRGRNAARRAAGLFELVTGADADSLEPLGWMSTGAGAAGARPSVLVSCPLDTLTDGTTPAWLLSSLAGRIKVTSQVARDWIDTAGADVRLVVMDDVGEVVGVGRRQRHARGWLRDAVIARDLHDTAPASTTPATLCDVDHAIDWERGGPTDVDNLSLVSRRFNAAKQRGQWTLRRHPDGTRTWTATASGYTIRQAPPAHLPRHPGQPFDPSDQPHGPDP